MENPIAVANYFVKKANSEGWELTPMKLLKMVYLAHGWYLGLNNGEPLIPEFAQAWKYGPVIQSVYDKFKKYKDQQITSLGFDGEQKVYPISNNPEILPFLDKIAEVYRPSSGLQLSTLTHQQGSPWYTVWNERGGNVNHGVIIPNQLIADYYKQKAGL